MNHERRFQIISKSFGWVLFVLFAVTILGVVAPDTVQGIPEIPSFAGEFTFFVLLFGWPLLYIVGWRLLKIWDRKSIAEGTPFTPQSNGPFLRPDLVGDISGREVRFTTVSGNHSVITDLDPEPTAGAIVGRPDAVNLELADHADQTGGNLAALASDEALADDLLVGRSREALATCEDCSAVFAGNVPAVFDEWNHEDGAVVYENGDEQVLGWEDDPMIEETVLRDRTRTADGELQNPKTTAGRDTVVHVTRHDRVSSDALQAQAAAVVAVADAFEAATSTRSSPDAETN